MSISMELMGNMAPASWTTLEEAIGKKLLAMTVEQLQDIEGNIGQLILAQAAMFIKTQYMLRECIPTDHTKELVEAFSRCKSLRGDSDQPARRRL